MEEQKNLEKSHGLRTANTCPATRQPRREGIRSAKLVKCTYHLSLRTYGRSLRDNHLDEHRLNCLKMKPCPRV